MPGGYSFGQRSDIEKTLELIRRPQRGVIGVGQSEAIGSRPAQKLTETIIYLTPSGGIPARSGTTPGEAECTPYYIDESSGSPVLTELDDDNGDPQTHTVYHIGSAAIKGSTYIQATYVFGVMVAIMEDCA